MKKIPVFLFFALSLFFTSTVSADFTDVPEDSEYQESISALTEMGVIQGYTDDLFRPDRFVSRAEFLKMVYLARTISENDYSEADLELILSQVDDLTCFDDMDGLEWFAPMVCLAKQDGVIEGYADGEFKGEIRVNLAEASKVLVESRGDIELFNDYPHWASGYFGVLFNVLPTSFTEPDQPVTRAEAAEMIWRFFIADSNQLTEKSSTLMVWDQEISDFLALDFIGVVNNWIQCDLYAKSAVSVYRIDCHGDSLLLPNVVEDADLNTFEVMTFSEPAKFSIALDGNSLYNRGILMPGTFGGSFSLYETWFLDSSFVMFGHDSKNVYPIFCYEGCGLGQNFPSADPDTFLPLDYYFSKDVGHVYYFNPKLIATTTPEILEADPDTFEHIPFLESVENCTSSFYRDKNSLFVGNKLVPDFDPNSFELLHDYGLFFADNDGIYRLTRDSKGSLCDPANAIKMPMNSSDDFEIFGSNYFLSDGTIYFVSTSGVLKSMNVNLDTFETFLPNNAHPDQKDGSDIFAKDKNYIYYTSAPLEGVDVETFHRIDSYLEGNELYYWADKFKTYSWLELNKMLYPPE